MGMGEGNRVNMLKIHILYKYYTHIIYHITHNVHDVHIICIIYVSMFYIIHIKCA